MLPDPLASLFGPSATGLTNYGAANIGGNSGQTLKPGIYSQISISGSASVTFCRRGLHHRRRWLHSAGMASVTVSGVTSQVTGSGILIYNTGSSGGTCTVPSP